MDEVLVNISPEMYRIVRLNWRKYHRWFKDLGSLTDKQILDRPHFDIVEWLLKDEIKALPEENQKKTREQIWEFIKNDCFEIDLYALLEPTEFAKRTIMNKIFMEHIRVNKVYILTRYTTDTMLKSKQVFIKKFFNHPKVELVPVRRFEKKSEILKQKKIKWNVLVDDEIKNIADFAENLDIAGKEFLIPAFGYNQIGLALDILIKEKGGVYNYYDI
jgi:hypothetical protein